MTCFVTRELETYIALFEAASLGILGRQLASTSAFVTHSLSVCAVQPILAATEETAAHRQEYSPS